MSVVDAISVVETSSGGPFSQDVPTEDVVIQSTTLVACDEVVQPS